MKCCAWLANRTVFHDVPPPSKARPGGHECLGISRFVRLLTATARVLMHNNDTKMTEWPEIGAFAEMFEVPKRKWVMREQLNGRDRATVPRPRAVRGVRLDGASCS